MYSFIEGKVVEKDIEKNLCIVEVNDIGYELTVSNSTLEELNISDEPVKFYIVEVSGGLYSSGLPTLYGFLSREEKEIFLAFKNNLSNVGPKKSLEYLDKVKKNITEFKSAIKNKNHKILTSLFGFKHSSAEKIISALSSLALFTKEEVSVKTEVDIDIYTDVISALVKLGYKESEIKKVVQKILVQYKNTPLKTKTTELISEVITLAIKELSTSK
ncbi:MAG: hypothetical protein N2Z73_02390 [Endomicrobia bacterium]|nr:hypothetical protein [Endomicrobiia bacterium]